MPIGDFALYNYDSDDMTPIHMVSTPLHHHNGRCQVVSIAGVYTKAEESQSNMVRPRLPGEVSMPKKLRYNINIEREMFEAAKQVIETSNATMYGIKYVPDLVERLLGELIYEFKKSGDLHDAIDKAVKKSPLLDKQEEKS